MRVLKKVMAITLIICGTFLVIMLFIKPTEYAMFEAALYGVFIGVGLTGLFQERLENID